jgi:hypothetical protein
MRTNSESGIPPEQQVEFYRDYVYRHPRGGRLVKLDLRGWVMSEGMLEATGWRTIAPLVKILGEHLDDRTAGRDVPSPATSTS